MFERNGVYALYINIIYIIYTNNMQYIFLGYFKNSDIKSWYYVFII